MKKHWHKIPNIFHEFPNYNCFVCAPHHDYGFRLEFFHDTQENCVVSPLNQVKKDFNGFPGILHGGFQAMLLDEIMFWAVYQLEKKMTVSADLQVKYEKAVQTESSYLIKGRLLKSSTRIFKTEGTIEDESGNILCRAAGTYIIPRKEVFQQALGVSELPEKFLKLL